MTRINVYAYPDSDEWGEQPWIAGWFDDSKATGYGEGTRWDGSNNVSLATGSNWAHEHLYRTSGGRWVLASWSQWQGVQERAWYVDADTAREWLLRNEYTTDQIGQALGEDVPDESPIEMGRPPIGPQVKVRLRPETLAQVDEQAAEAGVSRSEWIRATVERSLAL